MIYIIFLFSLICLCIYLVLRIKNNMLIEINNFDNEYRKKLKKDFKKSKLHKIFFIILCILLCVVCISSIPIILSILKIFGIFIVAILTFFIVILDTSSLLSELSGRFYLSSCLVNVFISAFLIKLIVFEFKLSKQIKSNCCEYNTNDLFKTKTFKRTIISLIVVILFIIFSWIISY